MYKIEEKCNLINFVNRLCHCQKEAGNAAESRKACGEAIKIEPDEPRLYCDRAEAYLLEDMFDEVNCIKITVHKKDIVHFYNSKLYFVFRQ